MPPEAAIVRGVLVPVPREVFKTLDRFANSNWRDVQRAELAHWRSSGEQTQNALLLGAVIAEGFIAVEAEDAVETKELGRAVLRLARGLGVEKAALRRSRSIVEHADEGDWKAVRKEWDGILPDVQQGMNDLRSEQLAQFVSLGGWLRGIQALTALVAQNYSDENAQLLRQPAVLSHFETQLAGLDGNLKRDPIVVRMAEGVREMKRVTTSGEAQVSRAEVQTISRLSAKLLKSLSR